jgi:inhibitor of cysteine peptidase
VHFSPPEPFNGKTYVDIIGTLPDGCTEIEDIDHSYEDATVEVTITVSRPEGGACAQVVTTFKETIRVETGNLYPGTYTVTVNGESFAFPWDMEFIVPLTPDPGS